MSMDHPLPQKLSRYCIIGSIALLSIISWSAVQAQVSMWPLQDVMDSTTELDGVRTPQIIDLDQDGFKDILYATRYGDIRWHKGLGDSISFEFEVILQDSFALQQALAVDLNGDDILDIVTSNSRKHETYVYFGTGNLNYMMPVIYALPFDYFPQYIHFYDIDSDSIDDLLIYSNSGIGYHKVNPSGSLGAFTMINDSYGIQDIDIVDLDGDGIQDIAIANSSSYHARWIRVLGNGTFTPMSLSNETSNYRSINSHDFDSDGDMDVLIYEYSAGKLQWAIHQRGINLQ